MVTLSEAARRLGVNFREVRGAMKALRIEPIPVGQALALSDEDFAKLVEVFRSKTSTPSTRKSFAQAK